MQAGRHSLLKHTKDKSLAWFRLVVQMELHASSHATRQIYKVFTKQIYYEAKKIPQDSIACGITSNDLSIRWGNINDSAKSVCNA